MDALAIPARLAVRSKTDNAIAETQCLTDLQALDAALDAGLRREWSTLLAVDPLSSVYQSPGWCLPWYHCYRDDFSPCLLVIRDAGALVGVVPMAIERANGRLVFASDTMADYRDVVARPGSRRLVVEALILWYVQKGFAGPLQIGWLDPASDTAALVADVCREHGLHCASVRQPCWRWFPEPGENLHKKFSRVRTHLNHFKRQGDVAFEIVSDPAAWSRFRDTFVLQHSLRQLQTARDVSLADPRRQQLYDALFSGGEVRMHVSACRVDGRMIAGHVGVVWRDVLLFGAPSISLEDEHRSPSVILMTWIIQNAEQLGLAGLDLTIGDSEFKRRLGNRCVDVTMMEVYARRGDYLRQQLRTGAVRTVRRATERVLGDGEWEKRLKPAFAAAQYKWRRLGELGVRGSLVRAARLATGRSSVEIVYAATPDMVAPANSGDRVVRENHVEDLLLWHGRSPSVTAAVNACARHYAKRRAAHHTLYTVIAGTRLLGWCYADHDVLYDVVGVHEIDAPPEYEPLIHSLAAARFAAGAPTLSIVVPEDERLLRVALGGLGFRIGTVAQ